VLHELLQENDYSNISMSKHSSDSKINVKISSCDKHKCESNEEENVSDNSSNAAWHMGKVRC
jgi:hypothetical protein